MRLPTVLSAALFWLLAANAQAAGLSVLEVPADGDMPVLKGAVWSPCAQPAKTVKLRRVEVAGARDCPIEGKGLALVVISHGAFGWFGGHHDTAAALADAGYVVAAITHPDDRSRRWRTERPAAIKRVIDHMLTSWHGRTNLDPERIGVFGFSRGGYTGLVAIGARTGFPPRRRILPQGSIRPAVPVFVHDGSDAVRGPRLYARPAHQGGGDRRATRHRVFR